MDLTTNHIPTPGEFQDKANRDPFACDEAGLCPRCGNVGEERGVRITNTDNTAPVAVGYFAVCEACGVAWPTGETAYYWDADRDVWLRDQWTKIERELAESAEILRGCREVEGVFPDAWAVEAEEVLHSIVAGDGRVI